MEATRGHDAPPEPEIEARLRSATPRPDPAFVARLEERVVPVPSRPRRRLGLRPAFAAAIAVAALAALTLVLGLAGIGPLDSSGNDVRAGDDCRTVTVVRTERVPILSDDGTEIERFEARRVRRQVRRCH